MKRVVLFLLALCVVLCGCSSSDRTYFDYTAYKEAVGECREHIMDATLTLGYVGMAEVDGMKDYQERGEEIIEDAFVSGSIDGVTVALGEDRDSLEAMRTNIAVEYAEIFYAETGNAEAETLKMYLRDMYGAFCNLYDNITNVASDPDLHAEFIERDLTNINDANNKIAAIVPYNKETLGRSDLFWD